MIEKYFVTFYSPGTFVAETDIQEIDSWNVEEAKRRAKKIKQRHGAIPYAFSFSTRTRGPDDLDSHVAYTSPYYFINCTVHTLKEIENHNDPNDKILLSNMRNNGYDRVATTIKGWKWTQPVREQDVFLP